MNTDNLTNTWKIDTEKGKVRAENVIKVLKNIYPDYGFKFTMPGGEADKELSVDVIVELSDRTECWAIKIRDEDKKSFEDITVEYKNGTGVRGDWFRFKGGVVQKYIYGYSNGKINFYVINIRKMMSIPMEKWGNEKNKKHGSSTFKTISNDILKQSRVIEYNSNKSLPRIVCSNSWCKSENVKFTNEDDSGKWYKCLNCDKSFLP